MVVKCKKRRFPIPIQQGANMKLGRNFSSPHNLRLHNREKKKRGLVNRLLQSTPPPPSSTDYTIIEWGIESQFIVPIQVYLETHFILWTKSNFIRLFRFYCLLYLDLVLVDSRSIKTSSTLYIILFAPPPHWHLARIGRGQKYVSQNY